MVERQAVSREPWPDRLATVPQFPSEALPPLDPGPTFPTAAMPGTQSPAVQQSPAQQVQQPAVAQYQQPVAPQPQYQQVATQVPQVAVQPYQQPAAQPYQQPTAQPYQPTTQPLPQTQALQYQALQYQALPVQQVQQPAAAQYPQVAAQPSRQSTVAQYQQPATQPAAPQYPQAAVQQPQGGSPQPSLPSAVQPQVPQVPQGRAPFTAIPGPVIAAVPPPTVIPTPAPSALPGPAQAQDSLVLPDNSVLAPGGEQAQGVIAGGACGPIDDGCPGYRLYAIVDALFLARYSGIANRPLAFNENTGATLLTSQDLQWAFAPGVRAFFGERKPGNCGWEVGYLGVYGMNTSTQAYGPGNLIAPGDLGANASQFNSADLMNINYQSTLNMAEANLFWYECCGTGGCQSGCQDGSCQPQPTCGSCSCIDWLAGFRFAGLNESANFASTCCGLTETSVYGVGATSNLFGAQVGVRGRRDYAHWACEGWMKVGLAGVWMNQTQSPIIDFETGIPYRGASSSNASGLAGFADANASAIYKFNRMWGLRLGVNAIWLGNVALAPDQWDFSQTASVTSIDTASLILLGANVGIEARW